MALYKNWNIIDLTPKSTSFEAFNEIHKVVFDGISKNMASLFQSVMYGDINTDDTTTNGFYVNSSQKYIRYKIIQKFMDKLFLLVNYFSRHNIFAPCNKAPIRIGNNNHCNKLSQLQHSQYFIYLLMLSK